MHLYWKQEEKYLTGQRNEDMRDEKGKVLAEADKRARRQYKEIKNREKLGKQDMKRCKEQGRKTIMESERINISQRRQIGKWKERTREETEEKSTVSTSQKLLEEILKRLVRLEKRDNEDRPIGLSKRRTEEEEGSRSKGQRRCKEQYK
ncbi:16271_t:CDS:2, partial [Gigaspora rosea]